MRQKPQPNPPSSARVVGVCTPDGSDCSGVFDAQVGMSSVESRWHCGDVVRALRAYVRTRWRPESEESRTMRSFV